MYNGAIFILLFVSLAHRHSWKVLNTNEIQFFTQTFPFSETNCCCWLKLHFGQFIQRKRPNTLLQIYFKHPRQNMFLNILRKKWFNTTSSVEQHVVNPRFKIQRM